jgi:hypothetical protein
LDALLPETATRGTISAMNNTQLIGENDEKESPSAGVEEIIRTGTDGDDNVVGPDAVASASPGREGGRA